MCFTPWAGTFDLYFRSKGNSLENSKAIGYKGGYIEFKEASVKLFSSFWMNSQRFGHLRKNYNKLNVGLTPTVRFDNTVKSIKDEFLTPHSSLVNPLIDDIKASET